MLCQFVGSFDLDCFAVDLLPGKVFITIVPKDNQHGGKATVAMTALYALAAPQFMPLTLFNK